METVILNILYIKTDIKESNNVAMKVKSIDEIANLYITSGKYNLIAKTITRDKTHFEILRQEILKIPGISELSFQIISNIIKDRMTIPIEKEVQILISCIMCNNPVHSFSFRIMEKDFSEIYVTICQITFMNKFH